MSVKFFIYFLVDSIPHSNLILYYILFKSIFLQIYGCIHIYINTYIISVNVFLYSLVDSVPRNNLVSHYIFLKSNFSIQI